MSMADFDFFLGQDDTSPNLDMTLVNPDGTPRNLTGETVTFMIQRTTAPRYLTEGSVTILDAPTGRIRYTWGTTDAAIPGVYEARVKVTTLGGQLLSFPNYRTLKISVSADP